jgi:pilus assembly protein CpaC
MKNCWASSWVGAGTLLLTLFWLFCTISFAAEAERRTLELKLGGSELIKTSHPFRRVSLADPTIADVVVLSPTEIYIFGKKVGYTSMILWEADRGKTLLDVTVSLDLTALKGKLHDLYPDQQIEVYGTETGVVLSGTVSGPEIVEQVLRLTQTYLPKEATAKGGGEGTGRSRTGITNLLKVGSIQQVMLEVKFAEVRRDSNRDWQAALGLGKLGSDFTGAAGVGSVLQPFDIISGPGLLPGGVPITVENGVIDGLAQNTGSLLLNFADNPANIFVNIDNFTAAFRFLEGEGLARLLAEPRLLTQSGQEASFLAGGEFPIPVQQGGTTAAAGGITIEFKEFGVGLVFTPVVMSDGKISLRVAPSVTSITSTSVIPSGIVGANFIVPSLSTRKLETTVQLYDGQTLALAGLLQDNINESVRKIPGLGDIPILGSLFRSSSFQQEKTDLLVTVTPHLIKPDRENTISYPGEYFQIPNRFEFYLEGRLEGRRSPYAPSGFGRHSFAEQMVPVSDQGGLEGQFGNQPVTVEQ